jgi:adenosine deaminase
VDPYVTDNLVALQQAANLERGDLVQLQRNALEISWLPSNTKDELMAELDSYAAIG